MDKTNPPETFGVFKPVDHTVITYKTAADMQSGVDALAALGFEVSDMARYAPHEMLALVDAQLIAASPLAAFGYELDLIKIHRAMAQEGCSFLVAYAPDETLAEQVAKVAQASHAVAAQHYGTFMIKEVLEPTPGETSPAIDI